MNWQLAEDLALRLAALRHAQSPWANERFQSEAAQRQWAERSPEAYDLRNVLVHTFRFAFRRNAELRRSVDKIDQGTSNADMLQDLKDLSVMGRRNTELLAAINFDTALLDRCETMADCLGRIYAETRNDRASYRAAKRARDRIGALLKASVDEIRAYGQFVFWRDGQRRKGYTSDYTRSINKAAGSPVGTISEAQTQTEPAQA